MNDVLQNVEASTYSPVEEVAKDEDFILAIQDHWVWLIRPSFFLVSGMALAVIAYYLGYITLTFSVWMEYFFYLVAFVVLTVSVHFFFLLIFQWLVSTIVFSNKRIIDFKYAPFVIDDINHIVLEKINDIEKTKHGIVKNVLNYGELHMSVAGMHADMKFRFVREPSRIVNFIQAVKLGKPLEQIDLRRIGATFSKKYSHLKGHKH